MSIGPIEIIVVIVILLLLFGARRLPELGSSLGQSIRGFGKGISGDSDEEPPEEEPRKLDSAEKPGAPAAERPAEKTSRPPEP